MNTSRILPLAFLLLFSFSDLASGQTPYEEEGRVAISLQGNSAFSANMDVDGDVAVLGGSPAGTPGRAVVFERTAGDWAEAAVLDPSMPGTTVAPAVTVAVSGQTIATSQGFLNAVDLYERLNGAWTFVQRLNAPTVGGFGRALALDGDTLVIGAPDTASMLGGQVGAAYVYREVGGTWSLEQTLVPATADESDLVGISVALDGDTLIVGSLEYGVYSPLNGSAYVYTRSGSLWTLEQRLMASDGAVLNGFGEQVALEGDHAVALDGLGSVYLFERSGGAWSELQKLAAPGGMPFGFKTDLAIDSGVVLIAAGNMSPAGAAFVFEDTGAAWTRTQTLSPSNPQSDYQDFGAAADVSEGQLLCWAGAGTDFGSAQTLFTFTAETGDYPLICFGDAQSQTVGCATCPCANLADPSSRGGCLNSAGRSGRLRATGAASASADSLEFRLRDAAPDTFALLFAGSDLLPQGNASCPPGSGVVSAPVIDGLRCVGSGAAIVRLGVRATDSQGDGVSTWGGGAPLGGLIANGGFTAGETRHFQCFYRDDASAGCGSGQNSTNAVTVLVAP